MTSYRARTKQGSTLVEVLVGSAILVLVLVAFTSSLSLFSQASEDATERAQALFLAQEGIEVARGLRDASWSTNIEPHTLDTPYGLSFDGGAWSIVSSPQVTDGFERSIEFAAVERDGDDDIAESGTVDDEARYVAVRVSWDGGSDSLEIETVLTDLFDN